MDSEMDLRMKKEVPNRKLNEILFNQIGFWLSRDTNKFRHYKKLKPVADRRQSPENWVCKNEITGKMVVLKSFNIERNWDNVISLLYDTLVPVLVDSSRILKFTDMFIYKNVSFILRRT